MLQKHPTNTKKETTSDRSSDHSRVGLKRFTHSFKTLLHYGLLVCCPYGIIILVLQRKRLQSTCQSHGKVYHNRWKRWPLFFSSNVFATHGAHVSFTQQNALAQRTPTKTRNMGAKKKATKLSSVSARSSKRLIRLTYFYSDSREIIVDEDGAEEFEGFALCKRLHVSFCSN